MVKIEEIDRTSTFAWNNDCLPLLATGTVAGAVDLNFNSSSSLELWDIFSATDKKLPIFLAPVDNRFHALAWSKPFDTRPKGLLAGAFENGVIEFWDVDILIKTKDLSKASVHKSEKHSGDVKTLAFNPNEDHILVSGGSKGQIFIWDCKSFNDPTSPGKAMTPMDEVSCVAWNNSVSHIFASTGNGGYTSIWDLKSKREVLHLAYNGELGRANFSFVAWHPTQSTKLITASDNDGCPIILTWDLRNSNAPEKILKGHKKGVLSLDWCKQDPELLISSGKDNTTIVWNPITGVKLGEYPTTANWAFLSKFAPNAPDIFATASYDGKITVQTLQDTSPPIATKANTNENDFWNEIATTETQQPVFEVKQAPAWLKRPSSVGFGFGAKLVTVTKNMDGQSVIEIKKFSPKTSVDSQSLNKALDTNDFSEIIDKRLEGDFVDPKDKSDWELLKKLSSTDKKSLFTDAIKNEIEEEPIESNGDSKPMDEKEETAKDGDDFFLQLGDKSNGSTTTEPIYNPTGSFKLFDDSTNDLDKKLISSLLANKVEDAVKNCLESDKLIEALVLSLDASDSIKEQVKNAYFNKNKDSELARIIYSSSSKNVTDIVANADVSDWKIIANSISAYCTDPADYNSKISELGDKILENNSADRENAILCYLAGGSIDKIASIWLKELPDFETKLLDGESNNNITTPSDAHFESLYNFAGKISAYRAISKESGVLSGPSIEPVCKIILEFANLLANNGEFAIAEKFSSLLPDDFAGSKAYKERISKANGTSTVPAATRTSAATKGTGRYNQYAQPTKPLVSPAMKYAQPSVPSIPPAPTPSSNGAPLNPYTRASSIPGPPAPGASFAPGAAAPFTPAAAVNSFTPAANPYTPPTNPYAAPDVPTNPYMRQQSSVVSPPPAGGAAPPPAGPPKPKYKEVTDGWNDLPETFKQKPEVRRAAPAAVSPASTPFPGPTAGFPSTPGSQRASVVAPPPAPPTASGPPPQSGPRPLSRSTSKVSVPAAATPRASISLRNNRYAPAAGSPVQPPVMGAPGSGLPQPPTAGSAPPPVNPYAAPTPAPPMNPYAAPSVPSSVPALQMASPRTSYSATAVKNPYAPPPAAVNGAGPQGLGPRPPTGGVIPPKPTIQSPANGAASRQAYAAVPPPPGPNFQAPPPLSQPQAAVPPPPPATKPQEPEPEKFPPGDRSHIPEEVKPVFEILSSVHEEIKPKIPEKYVKHGIDMEKRLNILYDHLNNSDLLSSEGINSLKEICDVLQAKNYQEASRLILSFAATYPDEIGHWHAGVKRLISMAEALGN